MKKRVSISAMLQSNIRKVFAMKGISNPQAWMLRRGIPLRAARHYLNGKDFRIRLSYLTILCAGLQCTPDDLFTWVPDALEKLPDNHPLHRLRENSAAPNVASTLQSLTVGEIKRVGEFVKGMRGS